MNTMLGKQNAMNAFIISDFFQLLSVTLNFPDSNIAEAIVDGRYAQDAVNLLKELFCEPEDIDKIEGLFNKLTLSENDPALLLTKMKQEYTRLFDSPKEPVISIYETLFLHNSQEDKDSAVLFVSPIALDVEHCYKSAGVSLANQFAQPADHMSTELEFMMYLYAKKGEALHNKNDEQLAVINKQIEDFLEKHLNKWVIDFFAKMETETELLAYQVIAQVGILGLKKILEV
ncbi:MAG: molecular chaperone TorD family protein [Syntrophomonadaceae bacterium]|nr:molecular chaperone TorD family protein [Syntrophomonadaceae bacterium]